ncbi:MAG TPA: FAD-binding protein [Candidatus Bathyarchaeia archaeon]|nr:FAD-binding protein [Candidatus Bathyarchaeia archaeon]
MICPGQVVLPDPSDLQIADCLGFNDAIEQKQVRDVVIIGAGPSGLAAAIYGGSEGLDVLVAETSSPGADPNTPWLNGCVALDAKGFIKTGRPVARRCERRALASWPFAVLARNRSTGRINRDLLRSSSTREVMEI